MSQPYAKAFYDSTEWHNAKEAHLRKVGRLCERCLLQGIIEPARVVHHKIPITPANIYDVHVTLDDNNLMALCMDCHAEVHKGEKRWTVTEDGSVESKEIRGRTP